MKEATARGLNRNLEVDQSINQSMNPASPSVMTRILASTSDRTKESASACGEVTSNSDLQKTVSNRYQSTNQSMNTYKMASYLFCKRCKNNLTECTCKNKVNNSCVTHVTPASEARPGLSGPAITTQAHNFN